MPRAGAAVLLAAALALAAGGATARGEDGDALAMVNGHPIAKARVVEVLIDGYGLRVMQQLIALELAKEETARLKLHVTPAEVEAEFRDALEKIAPPTDAEGRKLGEEEKRQSLDMLLQGKNLTLVEFRLAMERNAYLRKIVEGQFRVDEPTLREEFARLYGEKVEIRHIQVDDIPSLHEALDLLGKDVDFAEVARRVSKNAETAARGGLLEPFTFSDANVAALLREQAFALKPGEVSKPLHVGIWWHIVKLERRIAPEDVRFEDVRSQVEKAMRDRVIPERMKAVLTELVRKADVRVLEPGLKQKYEEMMKQDAASEPLGKP